MVQSLEKLGKFRSRKQRPFGQSWTLAVSFLYFNQHCPNGIYKPQLHCKEQRTNKGNMDKTRKPMKTISIQYSTHCFLSSLAWMLPALVSEEHLRLVRNTWTFESWHPILGGFGRWGMVMRFSLQWNVAGLAFPNLKCCRLDDETFWGLLFASSWCDLEGDRGCQHEHGLLIQCEIGTHHQQPPAYRSACIYIYIYRYCTSLAILLVPSLGWLSDTFKG